MSDPTSADSLDPTPSAEEAELLGELRLAVAWADPLPPRLLESARAAFVWRTIDEELAHLQFDSLVGSEVLVRSDGAGAVHLSFATAEASVEIEAAGEAITGQVVPGSAVGVSLLAGSGQRSDTTCDQHGQFSFDQRPSGPLRLVAHLPAGDVVTEWFTV